MKSRLLLLLLAAHAGSALAQYKCTAPDGRITFQQTPCFGAAHEEKLVVIPNGHPPSASAGKVETNIDKRMLARYERERQRRALAQAVQDAQDDKTRRATQRAQALAAARVQSGDDPANAAALREATASIASRYDALGELDESRIRSAQKALDDWDRAAAQAAEAASAAAH